MTLATTVLVSVEAIAAELDLGKAVIVAPAELSGPERKAVQVLVEEVEKRTLIRWRVVHSWPNEPSTVIAVGPASQLENFAGPLGPKLFGKPVFHAIEGFRLCVKAAAGASPCVFVVGNDARGVLFGVGRLLREMHMTRGKCTLADNLDIFSAPKYPLRGHQLGYRPKTNSYDGWDLAQWDRYIRDLAIFGCNAIELIPPRSDDDADSPHFPLPPMDMMVGMSKIIDDYGLDVWIWYPAMDRDYSNPKTVEFALKEWGEVFRKLPRVDVVMVPGGDPGHTQPKYLMALLEKQTANLRKYHPKAQMWMSPQSFNAEWFEEFLGIMRTEPVWLGGIVHGPQVRMSATDLRKVIPAKYPIRRYPDITHSLRCEFPVPDWDLAYALTEAREVINPRPLDEAKIFHAYEAGSIGFLTYSEGCNDDVNKFVWSGLGWDSNAKVEDILKQYGRYFIGEKLGQEFSDGLLMLEKNWQGPLAENNSVESTLGHFKSLEKRATPRDLQNWRFQQALYRAYYDAYTQKRLANETHLERLAIEKLQTANTAGSLASIVEAESILQKASANRVATDLRSRVFELAEALFQSIHMQLSVARYKAIEVGRGANLDTIDVPLNNLNWLSRRFAEVRKLDDEVARLKAIDDILNWENPGPGGYFDDLGNPTKQPHLIRGPGFDKDPGFFKSPRVGFAPFANRRLSQCRHAETLFDTPIMMKYTDLDPVAHYRIRIVYAGDDFRTRIRLMANETIEIHPFIRKESQPVEFDIPAEATKTGTLILSFSQEPGRGGSGRGTQVAEVWLIKK